jgi:hypothetical protein
MTAAADLLHREIANPDTQWSLGTFGAIAEFARDRDEPVRLTRSDGTALHHNCLFSRKMVFSGLFGLKKPL